MDYGIVPDPPNKKAIIMRIATEDTVALPYTERISGRRQRNNHPDSKSKRVQGQRRRGSCN